MTMFKETSTENDKTTLRMLCRDDEEATIDETSDTDETPGQKRTNDLQML